MHILSPIILLAALVVQPDPAPSATEARATGSLAGLFRGDDYPPAAADRGAEGSVEVRLDVGADGRVHGCTVTRSSGHEDLDERTCAVLGERARYRPARDARGQPAPDTQTATISWRMHAPAAAARSGFAFAPFRMILGVERSGEGRQRCWLEADGRRVVERSGSDCTAFGPFDGSEGEGDHRLVIDFVPAGAVAAAREQRVGQLLAEGEAEIDIRPDGTVATCRILRVAGRFAGGDYCDYLRSSPNSFDPSTDGGIRSGRMRTSIYGPGIEI